MDYYKPSKGYRWWCGGKKFHIVKERRGGLYPGLRTGFCSASRDIDMFMPDRGFTDEPVRRNQICGTCFKKVYMYFERVDN